MEILMMRGLFVSVAVLFWAAVSAYGANIYVSTVGGGSGTSPSSCLEAIPGVQSAVAGDTVFFRGGTYPFNLNIKIQNGYTNEGTALLPIECKPYNGESVVFQGSGATNCFDIQNRRYWILRDFEITGYSNAVKCNPASYILLDNLYVHHTASVGIDFKGETHHVTVKNCEVAFPGGTGECFYVGSSGSFSSNICHENVIKNCYIHDTLSATQGDGIELKPLCWGNVVRDNVICRTNFPAVFSWGNSNTALARNVIEGNIIWGVTEVAIEVATRTIVKNNVVFNNDWSGVQVRSQSDTGSTQCRQVEILNNTFYANNRSNPSDYRGEVQLASALLMRDLVIANNIMYVTNAAFYAISVFPFGEELHNTSHLYGNRYYKPSNAAATFFVNQSVTDEFDLTGWQAYLASKNITDNETGSSYGSPGFTSATTTVPGADFYLAANITGVFLASVLYDIDGVLRANPPTVGAYEWTSGGSAGWPISADEKPTVSDPASSAGWDPDASGTQIPNVSVSAVPTSGSLPLDVAFHCTAVDPDGGTIASITWDFGDGSPGDSGADVNHTYTIAGTYTATAVVIDDDSESNTDTVVIYAGTAAPSGGDKSTGCGAAGGMSVGLVLAVMMLALRFGFQLETDRSGYV